MSCCVPGRENDLRSKESCADWFAIGNDARQGTEQISLAVLEKPRVGVLRLAYAVVKAIYGRLSKQVNAENHHFGIW